MTRSLDLGRMRRYRQRDKSMPEHYTHGLREDGRTIECGCGWSRTERSTTLAWAAWGGHVLATAGVPAKG